MKRISIMAIVAVLVICTVANATPKTLADAAKAAAEIVKTNANNKKIDADMEKSMMEGSKSTFITAYAMWKNNHMGLPNPTIQDMLLSVVPDETSGLMSYNSGNTYVGTANGQFSSAQSTYNMAGMQPPGMLQDALYGFAEEGWDLSSIGYGFAFIYYASAGGHFDDARLGYEEMTAYLIANP